MAEVWTNPEAVEQAAAEVNAARDLVCDLLLHPSQDDDLFAITLEVDRRLRRAEVLLTLGLVIMGEEVSG